MKRVTRMMMLLIVSAVCLLTLANCNQLLYYLEKVYKVHGKVTVAGSDGETPLGSVEVIVGDYQYSELTNYFGDYELELAEGTWTINFCKEGYEPAAVEVTVTEEIQRVEANVALEPIGALQDGTIRVRVTDVTTAGDIADNTIIYCAVGALGADLFDSDNYLGTEPQGTTFIGGIAEFVVIEFDNPAHIEMIFTGGATYDLLVLIDYDRDDEYSSGIDYITFQSVPVDGNTTLELVYPMDFSLAP